MEVLGQLERRDQGASIADLVTQLGLPRTTVYRILNSLQLHDMVSRDETGLYRLGRRLLSLASHVAARPFDLAAFATPILDQLSASLGEGSKLSVLDNEGVLVLAAVQGRRPYALSASLGQRLPVHAGRREQAAARASARERPGGVAVPPHWSPSRPRPSPIRSASSEPNSPAYGVSAGRRIRSRT